MWISLFAPFPPNPKANNNDGMECMQGLGIMAIDRLSNINTTGAICYELLVVVLACSLVPCPGLLIML